MIGGALIGQLPVFPFCNGKLISEFTINPEFLLLFFSFFLYHLFIFCAVRLLIDN